MITITKNGNAVLFEFEENQHYLYNGTIEVPLNSLSLVTDESEMFTFKKAATNDIFISARYDDVNMSKSQLIDFYIANMVGSGNSESGITSGDVQTMIDTSLEDYYDIDEIDAALSGKQNTLIAGSGITISGDVISAEGGNLVIELTQAEYNALVDKDPNAFYIITDAQEINISDYYTSVQTQSAINAAVSGKADTSSVYTKSEVDTALSGKQDTLIAGSGITISGNVISSDGGSITVDSALDSGSTNPVANSAITAALAAKQDSSTLPQFIVSSVTYLKNEKNLRVTNMSKSTGGSFINTTSVITINNLDIFGNDPNINLSLVETSAITTSITSSSTDSQVPSAKAVYDALQESGGGGVSESAFTAYSAATDARISEDEEVTAAALNALNDKFDGLRLKKLTQSEYDALSPNYDSNTLYVIVN